jgi:DNA-directed RNA polymerase subunit N (RpoN/RPB10)
MSVSLREKVAEIVYDTCYKYAKIRKKLNNVKPRGILDRGFEDAHETKKDIVNKATEKLITLIAKCATPTFSGEKEGTPKVSSKCDICGKKKECKQSGKVWYYANCDFFQPTEQKEYCECKNPTSVNIVKMEKPIWIKKEFLGCFACGKPIPAEKKECGCKKPEPYLNNDFYAPVRCLNCGKAYIKPEPKPKDRIEGILKQDYSGQHRELKDKINEIIAAYNKEHQ